MAVNAAELKTRFTADTTPTEKTLKGFIEKQSSVLQRGFGGIGAAMGLAAAAGLTTAGARWAGEAAKLASYNQQVKQSFVDLAGQAGQSSEEMLDALKRTSQGGIAEYDLMLGANRALMLGVADTSEEMSRLMQIAMQRGQALGLTDTQAFNDIITGLGRGSALILDNLGIVIDVDQAYADYAATLGKTAEQLSEVEKKQAMVSVAMRDAGGRSGPATVSPWEGWDAALKDFTVSIGDLLAQPIGQFMRDAAAGVRELKGALDATSEAQAETKAEMQELADTARLDEVRLQVQQLEGDYQNLVDTMGQAKADEIFNTDYGSGKPVENLRELRLLLGTLDAEYQKSAAEWSAGEDARTRGLLQSMAAAEAAAAAEKMLAGERRKATVENAMMLDEMVNDMAMTGAEDLFGDIGSGAWDSLNDLRATAISTYDEWIAKTHDAAIAQFMAKDAVESLVNELSGAGGGYDAATQSMIDNANRIAGMAEGVQQQLYGVIGESAFDNFDQYEQQLWDVFNAAVDGGRSAEEAFFMTSAAADEIVASVTGISGGTLDDLASAAFSAEQNLWGTEAAARALMSLLGQSQGTVDSMFMGAVGQGFDARGAQLAADTVNAAREQFISDMALLGTDARTAAYNLALFDSQTQDALSGVTGAYREHQQELDSTSRSTKKAGSAASSAADGLSELNSMLSKVPGLFDPSEVTQDDMAAGGNYQDKADEYLRRLRDEVQNGVDWEGVDIGDAASALGMDPTTAAEDILNAFQAAWADSSLFADPANMQFLDMAAIQASLDQQLASAEGEKNLRALFGIGSDEDVSAIAALGLEVQSGLAGWLTENGMGDAAASLAGALGTGIKDNGGALGSGIIDGANDWASSKEGQAALLAFGEYISSGISAGVTITPNLSLPSTGGGGASAGSGTTNTDGPVRAEAYGGVTVINNNTVRRPHDAQLVAQYTAQEVARRSRR